MGAVIVAALSMTAAACSKSATKYPSPKYDDGGVCAGDSCDASADGVAADSAAACTPVVVGDAGASSRCLAVIASGRNDVVGVALDGANVFWTEQSTLGYAVMRAPAQGGSPRIVVASARRAVALGGGHVFLNSGNGLVPTATADVSVMAPFQGFGRNVAARAADAYVGTCDGSSGSVLDLPTSGAVPTTVAVAGCMNDLALGGAILYGASIGGTDGSGAFVAAGIWAWPLDGTPGAPLVGGGASDGGASDGGAPPVTPYAPVGVVADAAHVYWTERGDQIAIPPNGAVLKVPLTGGAPEVLVAGLHGPGDLALDGDTLYWANTDGRIMKVSVAGGPATVLADGQVDPVGVTVDATSVYWANRGGVGAPQGAVLRLTPK